MKQQAISKIFNTAKHSQPHRVADFQIDAISELKDNVKKSQADLKSGAPGLLKALAKGQPDNQITASSTKKKAQVKVSGKRSAPVLDFSQEAQKEKELADLPVNKEVSKKRRLKGKP